MKSVAAVPPASTTLPAQIVFSPNVTDMPDGAKSMLEALAQSIKANDQMHIQVVAYASGTPEQPNQARRISLSRAISVRSYLIAQGVRSARIDVRALGNRPETGAPPDRVDVLAADR
jgi:outer membrane protein OmpA-like peptidoglycan-associated protein